jgi:hypothetical protein
VLRLWGSRTFGSPVCQKGGPDGIGCSGAAGPPGVSEAEFAEFQAWKARSQAAVATGVQDEGSDSKGEWDDQEYRLGAVALPMSGGCGQEPQVQ